MVNFPYYLARDGYAVSVMVHGTWVPTGCYWINPVTVDGHPMELSFATHPGVGTSSEATFAIPQGARQFDSDVALGDPLFDFADCGVWVCWGVKAPDGTVEFHESAWSAVLMGDNRYGRKQSVSLAVPENATHIRLVAHSRRLVQDGRPDNAGAHVVWLKPLFR